MVAHKASDEISTTAQAAVTFGFQPMASPWTNCTGRRWGIGNFLRLFHASAEPSDELARAVSILVMNGVDLLNVGRESSPTHIEA